MEIGIDIGGTHTRIVVADHGSPIGEVSAATADWRQGTLFSDEANADRLLALIPGGVVGRADVPLVAGVHGCDTSDQCHLLQSWLQARHLGPVLVVNDSELLGPAMGFRSAIAVVCGTGSIVVGRNGSGELVKVGGYGWLLGDPGAAPSLVREAVVAILQADDAGVNPGPLAKALIAHYGSPDPVGLGYDFTADAGITKWGVLAPLVFEAAERGDQLAVDVIETDGRRLADDVVRLRAKGVTSQDVVMAGGVVTSQPRLQRAFTSALSSVAPELRVHMLKEAPVGGALALAAWILQPTDAMSQRFPLERTGKEESRQGVR